MSRNRYPGDCYRCGEWVPAGEGHFERLAGHWRVQHAACAIEMRGTPDPARQEHMSRLRLRKAAGTGRRAQRARKTLRDMGLLPPAESNASIPSEASAGNPEVEHARKSASQETLRPGLRKSRGV